MSNPITNAIQKTASSTAGSLQNTVTQTVTSVIPSELTATANTLKKIPITKDPELVKKQIEGEVLTKKAEAEQFALSAKDMALEMGKQKLKELALAAIPFPPKLPVIDPKILQAVTLGLQAKQLWKQRKNLSKKNLQKSKDTFAFPLKPANLKPELPSVPKLPTNG